MSLSNVLPPLTDEQQAKIAAAGGVDGFLKWIDQRAHAAVLVADEAASWRDHALDSPGMDIEDPEWPGKDIADPDWVAEEAAGLEVRSLQIRRQIARDVPLLKQLGATPERRAPFQCGRFSRSRSPDPATITLSGVFEAWKEQVQRVAPEQYPVRLFEELHGALPVKDITVDHVRRFRDALKKMPRGKFAGLSMQQVLQVAVQREKLEPRKASTLGKDYRCFQAICAFAFAEQYMTVNVAASIDLYIGKQKHVDVAKSKRRTFSPKEMQMLFDGASGRGWRDKAENTWFLRLITWTGARPEELAQRMAKDLINISGHMCLDLHDGGDNHIKHDTSNRIVPVHPELLRLGFADFVKGAGNRPYLFSSLKADGRGRRYGRMQDRLTRLIDGKVSKDPRLVPYPLRHGFKDAMKLIVAPEWVTEAVMGHSNPQHKTGRGYGTDQIVIMAEWIAKADPFDKRQVVSEFEDDDDNNHSER
ncbi:hypothetical protein [Mesorhizobium sp.]|uniref:hypothetical protein n=2 Tax=Mesorhizobium sp. TaxID=1871066 RepID=UPI001215664D|nr:hypothetical protein [Mesorhizobium sp.]TIN25726.1 MAG: hypothetical protein E5Y19_16970 [Mesorhizobium sp.]TJU75689.1 MAG: hypothetical protein E5Y15_29530 [Mesorhizobium sp.]